MENAKFDIKDCFKEKKFKDMLKNKNIEINNAFIITLGKDGNLYISTIDNSKKIYELKEE